MSSSQPPRIFLIGFNKCGTTSFHDYFKANGITSVHWRANTLAMALHRNQLAGQPLLSGIEDWTAYTDMICIPGTPWERSNSDAMPLIEGCRLFRELHRAYPEALFILNTRDPMQWVRSRLKHDQGRFAEAYLKALQSEGIRNLRQLQRRWLEDWHTHHAEVLRYFHAHSRQQFLLFHISETPVGQLNRFLERHFELSCRTFPITTARQAGELRHARLVHRLLQQQPVVIHPFMTARLQQMRKSTGGEMNNRHLLAHVTEAIGHGIGGHVLPTPLGLTFTHPAQQVVLTGQIPHPTAQQSIERALLTEAAERAMAQEVIDHNGRRQLLSQRNRVEQHHPSVEVVIRALQRQAQ